jgi:hypothetical protein
MHHEEYDHDTIGVETIQPEFVPVYFARDPQEAGQLRTLFEQHDVPVLLDDGMDGEYLTAGRGVPVLVPEELHERASELLAEAGGAVPLCARDDDEEDEDFVEEDEEEIDDDFDDLDDLDDDFDEEEDDDFDGDFDDDEDL